MPRGSKPGERRGGRQRGTPNKKTALSNAAIAAAAANPDISPLEFLLGVMRDPNVSPELRIKAAQTAAPFVHAKPGSASLGDPVRGATLIDGTGPFTIDLAAAKALRDDYERLSELVRKRFGPSENNHLLSAAEMEEESALRTRLTERAKAIGCPAGYGPRQARIESDQLHQLHCMRISPGGISLTDAEDAEEAELRARVEAFNKSPEGRARSRIFELGLRKFGGGLSTAEQNELDRLEVLWPALPIDPDVPLNDSIEAWGREARFRHSSGSQSSEGR